jgi:hypothetical protein
MEENVIDTAVEVYDETETEGCSARGTLATMAVGSAITLAVIGLVKAGKWAYRKVRDKKRAKLNEGIVVEYADDEVSEDNE